MHYVIGDIHNNNRLLQNMLEKIAFGSEDRLYLLGDLFDRGGDDADPAGLYFTVLGLGERCAVVRGNHEQWLASYLRRYHALPEKKRPYCEPYYYNTFDIMQMLTPVDLEQFEAFLCTLPLQRELVLGEKKYLFAHAMASHPDAIKEPEHYLMGNVSF